MFEGIDIEVKSAVFAAVGLMGGIAIALATAFFIVKAAIWLF